MWHLCCQQAMLSDALHRYTICPIGAKLHQHHLLWQLVGRAWQETILDNQQICGAYLCNRYTDSEQQSIWLIMFMWWFKAAAICWELIVGIAAAAGSAWDGNPSIMSQRYHATNSLIVCIVARWLVVSGAFRWHNYVTPGYLYFPQPLGPLNLFMARRYIPNLSTQHSKGSIIVWYYLVCLSRFWGRPPAYLK